MKKPRSNGLILTAKNLSKRAYASIHSIPRGYRGPALKALLEAAANLAAKSPQWFRSAVDGHLVISAPRSPKGAGEPVAKLTKPKPKALRGNKPSRVGKAKPAKARSARDAVGRGVVVRTKRAGKADQASGQGADDQSLVVNRGSDAHSQRDDAAN